MTTRKGRGRPAHPDVLTPAEWTAVDAARHGMSTGEIARRRGVSRDAVKQQLESARDKLGLEGRDDLRAWTGVRADSPLHDKEPDMTQPLQFGPIGQIARSVKDVAAAETFYRDVLGLPHLYTFGTLAFFDCGGVRLFLEQGEGTDAAVIYFRVPDIRAAHAQLVARGVHFEAAPHLIHRHADGTEEWMAFFHDNEGRLLAIMSQVAPA